MILRRNASFTLNQPESHHQLNSRPADTLLAAQRAQALTSVTYWSRISMMALAQQQTCRSIDINYWRKIWTTTLKTGSIIHTLRRESTPFGKLTEWSMMALYFIISRNIMITQFICIRVRSRPAIQTWWSRITGKARFSHQWLKICKIKVWPCDNIKLKQTMRMWWISNRESGMLISRMEQIKWMPCLTEMWKVIKRNWDWIWNTLNQMAVRATWWAVSWRVQSGTKQCLIVFAGLQPWIIWANSKLTFF